MSVYHYIGTATVTCRHLSVLKIPLFIYSFIDSFVWLSLAATRTDQIEKNWDIQAAFKSNEMVPLSFCHLHKYKLDDCFRSGGGVLDVILIATTNQMLVQHNKQCHWMHNKKESSRLMIRPLAWIYWLSIISIMRTAMQSQADLPLTRTNEKIKKKKKIERAHITEQSLLGDFDFRVRLRAKSHKYYE